MKTLSAIYSSPWVPAPLLAACGFAPVPLYGASSRYVPARTPVSTEGRCPWSQSFAEVVRGFKFDAAIFTTTCDQMRRTSELMADSGTPVFTLTVPSTTTISALRLYQSELIRLTAWVGSISGAVPTADDITRAGTSSASRQSNSHAATPVCLLGSHLPVPIDEFEKLLAEKGGFIAVNGMEDGPAFTPDLSQLEQSDSLEALVASIGEIFFSSIKDAFARPNSSFYRWLSVQMKREAAKGIIIARNCWCDKWAIEAVRLREWSKLPILEIEFTSAELSLSAVSRLDAFMEACSQ